MKNGKNNVDFVQQRRFLGVNNLKIHLISASSLRPSSVHVCIKVSSTLSNCCPIHVLFCVCIYKRASLRPEFDLYLGGR